jgi:sec-independent protein translocase protein TatB
MSLVPQLGLPEIMVLAVLALLVIGPKDLPRFLHGAGKLVGKARRLADEFRMGISQMAREAELDEMRQEIERLKSNAGGDDATRTFSEIDREMRKKPESGKKTAGDDG